MREYAERVFCEKLQRYVLSVPVLLCRDENRREVAGVIYSILGDQDEENSINYRKY